MSLTGSVGDRFDMIANGPASAGEENLDRMMLSSTNNALTNQVLRLSYFTARRTESISQVYMITGGTAAGATPTYAAIGVYQEDPVTGNLTLVASTASDTTLFAATSTKYTKALQAAFTKRAGIRYAVGVLVVSAAAFPTFLSVTIQNQPEAAVYPRRTASIGGQATLPASIANASLLNSGMFLYAVLVP